MRAILLVALLLAPLAAADHLFSHRMVVEGRLIGGDGLPLPGRTVELEVLNERMTEACSGGHRPVTNMWGDFEFCYHRHELNPRGAIRVTSGNASASRPIDTDLRRMVFLLRDANATGEEPSGWNNTYFIDGRVWEEGPTLYDGVYVSGVTFPHIRVNVTVVNVSDPDDRHGAHYELPTDGFGTFSGRLFFNGNPDAADYIVRVSAQGGEREAPLDGVHHRNVLDLVFPLETEAQGDPPGTRSGPVSMQLVLAVVFAVSVAALLASRKKT